VDSKSLTLTDHPHEPDAIAELIPRSHFVWNTKHKHPGCYPVQEFHEADSILHRESLWLSAVNALPSDTEHLRQ
jgi:hypothetical protein